MTTTARLNIPLVEDSSNLTKDLWNKAYNQIDSLCVGVRTMDNIALDFTKGTTVEHQLASGQVAPYKVLHIIPHDPSNQANWQRIGYAVIRVYIKKDANDILVFVCEGIQPTETVYIDIIGWF